MEKDSLEMQRWTLVMKEFMEASPFAQYIAHTSDVGKRYVELDLIYRSAVRWASLSIFA